MAGKHSGSSIEVQGDGRCNDLRAGAQPGSSSTCRDHWSRHRLKAGSSGSPLRLAVSVMMPTPRSEAPSPARQAAIRESEGIHPEQFTSVDLGVDPTVTSPARLSAGRPFDPVANDFGARAGDGEQGATRGLAAGCGSAAGFTTCGAHPSILAFWDATGSEAVGSFWSCPGFCSTSFVRFGFEIDWPVRKRWTPRLGGGLCRCRRTCLHCLACQFLCST